MFHEIFPMGLHSLCFLPTWQIRCFLKVKIRWQRQLEEPRHRSCPTAPLNLEPEYIFLNPCYPLGFFNSYVHFLFQGVAGTCSGNQGCWWIQPRLSLPGVEWLYLWFHTAVCTDSLAVPGSRKDQSGKKSVHPIIDARHGARNYRTKINDNQWGATCFLTLRRSQGTLSNNIHLLLFFAILEG